MEYPTLGATCPTEVATDNIPLARKELEMTRKMLMVVLGSVIGLSGCATPQERKGGRIIGDVPRFMTVRL